MWDAFRKGRPARGSGITGTAPAAMAEEAGGRGRAPATTRPRRHGDGSATFPANPAPAPTVCVTSHPGSVAMAAAALNGLVAVLETYRGRDRVVSDGERPGGALSCR